MGPRLRISVSNDRSYPPIQPIQVNTLRTTPINTGGFEGEVQVWIKGYKDGSADVSSTEMSGETGKGQGGEFFDHVHERGEKRALTYAITMKGRFNEDINGDDLLFGNVFERPIRDHLPWGTSVAMRFTSYIDPTLSHDVYADKPWALSPVLACMSVLSIPTPASASGSAAAAVAAPSTGVKGKEAFLRERSAAYFSAQDEDFPEDADTSRSEASDSDGDEEGLDQEKYRSARDPSKKDRGIIQDRLERQKWFRDTERRENVVIKQGQLIEMEFSNGLVDFSTLSLNLPYPISMQIPLLQYWDGQPVIYVCRKRSAGKQSPVDPEGMFFSIGFEIVDEDAVKGLEKKGGEVVDLKKVDEEIRRRRAKGSRDPNADEEDEDEDENEGGELSDDVD